jgi:hypothetical protein
MTEQLGIGLFEAGGKIIGGQWGENGPQKLLQFVHHSRWLAAERITLDVSSSWWHEVPMDASLPQPHAIQDRCVASTLAEDHGEVG